MSTWVIPASALVGLVLGAILGFGKEIPGYLAQRLGLILLLLFFAEGIQKVFGWPAALTLALGVAVALVSPPVLLAGLCAYFLSTGIAADRVGAHVILLAVMAVVHFLIHGRWICWGSTMTAPRLPPGKARARSRQVTLEELVGV